MEWWQKEGYTSEENALIDKQVFEEIFGSEENVLRLAQVFARHNLDRSEELSPVITQADRVEALL